MILPAASGQDRPHDPRVADEGHGRERRSVAVCGIVQGVGFRPFVHRLAARDGLTGWVRNNADGVQIEVEGAAEALDRFLAALTAESPPLARIETIRWQSVPAGSDTDFRIEASRDGTERHALISPDVAICDACRRELFDAGNRRYRYPFINCTNCGPRFTITRSVPYDRPSTTMAAFTMCATCRREYDDPRDRRFHAQPNACPDCGPRLRLLDRSGREMPGDDPIGRAAEAIAGGAIVAIKGVGGFHLACDPFNHDAVRALRQRKIRQDKPFALMAADLDQVRALCRVGDDEVCLLADPARPIVLLARRPDAGVAGDIAPRQDTLGVMLPYTPLHHVLLADAGRPLVMTSGNRSDEPIAYRDEEARSRLGHIAEFFLVHDRPIHMRCDDSVVRVVEGKRYPIRRSRGYAPAPLSSTVRFSRHILACGAQLKNTFCLARENHLFVSHHIGDLENYETFRSFRDGIDHYCHLFAVRPALVAYDLHPEYLSTKYAIDLGEEGLPAAGVQHHHAHVASCLADNQRPWDERVIGVALDGTGYGTDGTIWGGEFFTGSIEGGFTRRAHLSAMPLPGGEAAIRRPWQLAVAVLLDLYGDDAFSLPLSLVARAGERNMRLIRQVVAGRVNAPLVSSAGRLFDAVAALLDVPGARRVTYEGQAAIELELLATGPLAEGYAFALRDEQGEWVIDSRPVLRAVVEEVLAGRPKAEIAARFHRTVAEMVVAACERLRAADGMSAVALSGGTFQNMVLLRQTVGLLRDVGFTVYLHHEVPANDGGISVGQAVLAEARARAGSGEEVGTGCA